MRSRDIHVGTRYMAERRGVHVIVEVVGPPVTMFEYDWQEGAPFGAYTAGRAAFPVRFLLPAKEKRGFLEAKHFSEPEAVAIARRADEVGHVARRGQARRLMKEDDVAQVRALLTAHPGYVPRWVSEESLKAYIHDNYDVVDWISRDFIRELAAIMRGSRVHTEDFIDN